MDLRFFSAYGCCEFKKGFNLSRKMTGVVKSFDILSGKGLIIPSDGRKDVLLHISAVSCGETNKLIPGLRIEFCRINCLSGPVAANIYLA